MFRLACGVCLVVCLLAACARGSAPSEMTVHTTGDVQVYGVYRAR